MGGCRNWLMKSSNKLLSVDPRYTCLSMMPSCAYAGRICHIFPRPNFVTWTGEDPFGDTPITDVQPFYCNRTHRRRQDSKTCTVISYVDDDLEGRYPVIMRCDRSQVLVYPDNRRI